MSDDGSDPVQGLKFIERYQNEIPNIVKINYEKRVEFESLDVVFLFFGIIMDATFVLVVILAIVFAFRINIYAFWQSKKKNDSESEEDSLNSGFNKAAISEPGKETVDISLPESLLKNFKKTALGSKLFPTRKPRQISEYSDSPIKRRRRSPNKGN